MSPLDMLIMFFFVLVAIKAFSMFIADLRGDDEDEEVEND